MGENQVFLAVPLHSYDLNLIETIGVVVSQPWSRKPVGALDAAI